MHQENPPEELKGSSHEGATVDDLPPIGNTLFKKPTSTRRPTPVSPKESGGEDEDPGNESLSEDEISYLVRLAVDSSLP